MRDAIISGLDNPSELEQLYRKNKAEFKENFNSVYTDYQEKPIVKFWYERLNYEATDISWGSTKELKFLFIAAIIAGFLAKLPDILTIEEDFFYPRNIGFLVFPFLTFFFAWRNKLSKNKILIIAGISLVSLLYINLLPNEPDSDTLILACIHLPLLLWVVLGIAFTSSGIKNYKKRLEFLSFNGELLVMSAMLVIAGIILTGITVGLFELIGLSIVEFYSRYIIIFVLPSVPLLACFLVQTNPGMVNKVSPVIAKIFSPIVLVTLVIYLGAIIASGKDPYTDRDFLILFNIVLLGVMALIFFSVTEGWKEDRLGSNKYILLPLALVTIIVNLIALSAIIFRISEWGFTPNRLAVLGGNILILLHLLLVTFQLFRCSLKKLNISEVGRSIVTYLPVYFIWVIVVIFMFPLIFGFK
ncbi:hypothetical protein [Christiangramia sediminis]|uniref:DUF4153 domain-containing protein n=1 Tax=Christiangramia sediminis TaxID=2881336 RepID=A0A9X1LIM1_9FLAO|nr:hypothetical protein [Christiangramia sediminis]MCB7481020.1 hypothetical protein [Christiangramia sediminis]